VWLIVAGLLIVSAVAKAVDGDLPAYLASTGMFPIGMVSGVALTVILAELLAAVLLLWPTARAWGWCVVAGLGSGFAVFHVSAAVLGDIEPCRCLAVRISHDALWSHVGMGAFCSLLVVTAVVGVVRRRPVFPVPQLAKEDLSC
jgi:hypothetical protein